MEGIRAKPVQGQRFETGLSTPVPPVSPDLGHEHECIGMAKFFLHRHIAPACHKTQKKSKNLQRL
jgi:hypothetical protein